MSTPAFITVDGRLTRVRVAGNPSHPPVVLIHGIGRSLEDWELQFPKLTAAHRVIALDMPGSGFSARSPLRSTLSVLARGVLDTLDALGEHRPAHLVAHSLGGAVALQLLVSSPHRVASLVLVDSAGFGAEITLPLRLLTVPVLGRLMISRTTRASVRMVEPLGFADPALATDARIEHALAVARQPDTNIVMWETARELATPRGAKAAWRERLLESVAEHVKPTLIMWGDRDAILPVKHFDAARSAMPHAQAHLFRGVGHLPQLESPDEFADRVLAFLTDVNGHPAHRKVDTNAQ
jgi:pimeloyl-ACP methyl ester carboxylesterase